MDTVPSHLLGHHPFSHLTHYLININGPLSLQSAYEFVMKDTTAREILIKKGHPRTAKVANRFYDIIATSSRRGNSPKSGDEHISQVFAFVFAGSIGFQRVVLLAIGLVQRRGVDDSRFRIFGFIFHFYSHHGADFPFQMYRTHTHTHTHTQTSGSILRYSEDESPAKLVQPCDEAKN